MSIGIGQIPSLDFCSPLRLLLLERRFEAGRRTARASGNSTFESEYEVDPGNGHPQGKGLRIIGRAHNSKQK